MSSCLSYSFVSWEVIWAIQEGHTVSAVTAELLCYSRKSPKKRATGGVKKKSHSLSEQSCALELCLFIPSWRSTLDFPASSQHVTAWLSLVQTLSLSPAQLQRHSNPTFHSGAAAGSESMPESSGKLLPISLMLKGPTITALGQRMCAVCWDSFSLECCHILFQSVDGFFRSVKQCKGQGDIQLMHRLYSRTLQRCYHKTTVKEQIHFLSDWGWARLTGSCSILCFLWHYTNL